MPTAVRIALPILLLAAVYFGWAPVEALSSGAGETEETGDATALVWSAAVLITGAANMLNACLDSGEGSPRRLAFWDMLLKLCTSPFFLFIFAAGFTMSLALAVVPGMIITAPMLVLMLAVIDYGLLLFTSSYGFVAPARARSQGLITDVVAAIILYVMVRKTDDAHRPEGRILVS